MATKTSLTQTILKQVRRLRPTPAPPATKGERARDYLRLYYDHLDFIGQKIDRPVDRSWVWVYIGLLGVPLLVQVILPGVDWRWLLGGIALILLGLYTIISLALLVQTGSQRLRRIANWLSPCLAAQLMTVERRPYSNQQGLIYPDLEHLKQFALLEGNMIRSSVRFAHLSFLGAILLAGGVSLGLWLVLAVAPLAAQTGTARLPTTWMAYASLVVLALLAAVLWRAAAALQKELSAEMGNRVLLLACEDALGLLEHHQLTYLKEFSLRQKRSIAEQLGCHLVLEEQIPEDEPVFPQPLEDSSEGKWYLVYPRKQGD